MNGGAIKAYSYLEFSPDGELIASLFGTPDYMLTLWNCKKQSIVLRSKTYSDRIDDICYWSHSVLANGNYFHWTKASSLEAFKVSWVDFEIYLSLILKVLSSCPTVKLSLAASGATCSSGKVI